MKYSIRPIKTGVISAPRDDLLKHIRQSALSLKEGDIVAVTSKVVGIWEGRTLPIDSIEKDELVKREAKLWLPRKNVYGRRVMHTITQGFLIASAGIDESNGNGWYILYPKDPADSARRLLRFFKKEYCIKKLGVIVTDIFGRPFHFSQSNVPDALAAAAVLAMGEGDEQTPLAVISGTKYPFMPNPRKKKRPHSSFDVTMKEDLFGVFLKGAPWRKGKGK